MLTFVVNVLYTRVPEIQGLHISQGTMSLRFPKPVVSEWRLGVRNAQVGHRAGGVLQPVVPVVDAALRRRPLVGARELGKVAQVDDPSRKNTDWSFCCSVHCRRRGRPYRAPSIAVLLKVVRPLVESGRPQVGTVQRGTWRGSVPRQEVRRRWIGIPPVWVILPLLPIARRPRPDRRQQQEKCDG